MTMFKNPFKKKEIADKLYNNLPKEVLLIGVYPQFGENCKLSYNEDSGQYETYLELPMYDIDEKEIDRFVSMISINPAWLRLKISKTEYAIMTEDDFKEVEFKKTKIDTLNELISKIEAL